MDFPRAVRLQPALLRDGRDAGPQCADADFAVAAKSLGFGHIRIMFRHLLPNAMVGPLVFSMS